MEAVVVPMILFALGFGGALVMRRIVGAATRRGRPADSLPVNKGAVQLDKVARKKRRK